MVPLQETFKWNITLEPRGQMSEGRYYSFTHFSEFLMGKVRRNIQNNQRKGACLSLQIDKLWNYLLEHVAYAKVCTDSTGN